MPLTIEDLLEHLYETICNEMEFESLDDWDWKFIENVATYSKRGNALSSKQASISINLIIKHINYFEHCKHSAEQIEMLCKTPCYRREPYQSKVIKSEVRLVVDDILCFRFKYNDEIIFDIRKLSLCKIQVKDYSTQTLLTKYPYCEKGLWYIKVTCDNVDDVMNFISKYGFHYSADVLTSITNIVNAKITPSSAQMLNDKIAIDANNNEFLIHWLQYLVDCEEANVFVP